MKEPITTDERISFVAARGDIVVYDRHAKCALCRKCLVNKHGRCPFGGPFTDAP